MAENEPTGDRDRALTILAVLMALLAVSNLLKPVSQAMAPDTSAGFVFFGARLHGLANAVVGPLFGALLAAYAWGTWHRRAWVLPIAIGYAAYVIVNLFLFGMRNPSDETGLGFVLVYSTIAIAISGGGAFYLYRNRDRLH